MMRKGDIFFRKVMMTLFCLFCFVATGFISVYAGTEENKAAHRAMAVKIAKSHEQVILAYEGRPLDDSPGGYLESKLGSVSGAKADFTIISLVRILYFTSAYDDMILPVLEPVLYWPKQGEEVIQNYSSENHMIMWLSSAYLLKQREGWEMDSLLEDRLRHFLDLKLTYGFYEWNSAVYLPYTLSALLNLADFAGDSDIRADAESAAKRLLTEMLRLTNDVGAFFPVSGRGKLSKYENAYTHNHSALIYILTQMGQAPTGATAASGFLSTSEINFDDVADSWTPTVNISYNFGHPINDSVHSGFPRQDRTFFQWSAGGYYHPDVAADTAYTINYYDMYGVQGIPIWLANLSSSVGATFSRSSVLSQAKFDIYKNEGVTLSSVDAYYPGYFGWQQWPWVAAVDDIAVWTQSGPVYSDWGERSDLNINTHLPRVMQDGNVALIMYWPNTEIAMASPFSDVDTDVALHWKDSDFDEVDSYDRWIIGRKGNSYIAVYRYRTGIKNDWPYSQANNGRQYWAVVVGNSTTHGKFKDFVHMVEQSRTRESYTWKWSKLRSVYYVLVTVDGKKIEYTW